MAQTQVQPEIQPTTPILNGESPEQKRVRGRPPGTGSRQQQEAERIQHEAAQREALADPFVTLLPKIDWRTHLAYIYRLGPITDRTGPGRAKYVVKKSSAFDEDEIMREHGSGRYRLDLVYCPPEGGNNRYVLKHEFQIMNPDYPPKVPAGQWLDDPRNAEWEWCRPAGAPGAANPNSPQALADAVTKLIGVSRPDLGAEENKGVVSQVLEMVQNDRDQMRALMDPNKQFETIKNLLALVAPKENPAGGQHDMLLKMLIDDRAAQRTELSEMRKLLMERPKEKGLLEVFLEAEPLIERVTKMFRGKGETATGTTWMDIADKALGELAPPIGRIAEALVFAKARPGALGIMGSQAQLNPAATAQQPMNAIERRKQAATARTAQTSAAPEAAQPVGAPPAAVGISEEDQMHLAQLWQKYGNVITQSMPFLVDHFRNGLTGFDFRDWFVTRQGMNWWTSLKTETKIDDLVNFIKFDAQLAAALQPEEKFRTFLAEFFTEPGNEPAESDGDEDDENNDDPIPGMEADPVDNIEIIPPQAKEQRQSSMRVERRPFNA